MPVKLAIENSMIIFEQASRIRLIVRVIGLRLECSDVQALIGAQKENAIWIVQEYKIAVDRRRRFIRSWRNSMNRTEPRYSKQQFADRGDAIYESNIGPHVEPAQDGKFVAIDIETGEYEIDGDEMAAADRLLQRVPDAQIWLRRIGLRCARRFGSRPRRDSL